ncbi:MAG: hypothetical protein DRJ40_01520 [Thermoprotei archaeon]|nr:MAG: hypothetical protein DRJ40_01520 [Thermoprotei archaeon]
MTAEKIVELFERDVRARRRLAELLVMEPDVRLAMINAVLRDVATKSDLERLRDELRNEFRSEIEKLRSEFRDEIRDVRRELSSLSERVARLEGRVDLLIKVFIGFNVPLLVAVIGILLKLIFG